MSTTKLKHTPIEAIKLLIDHASETYPHFESTRGQQDIERAREALAHIVNSHADMLEALERIELLSRDAINGIPVSSGLAIRDVATRALSKAKGGAA